MANRHLNGQALVPAVAYYRMSSDKQEASIGEQREAVTKYAADNGYCIIREYIDEGISGGATHKRKSFQRMIADAERGEFKAVLCWDQDRFGRFDSIEAGRWIYPLRQAGVKLATIGQGVVDWTDFAGRMIYGIQQEAKHSFLLDLSRSTMRSKLAAAKQGYWLSKPPYGYRLESDANATGKRKYRRLVLGDRQEVATVQRIFALYLSGQSIRSIACLLNAEGTSRKNWSRSTVQEVLSSKTYCGTYRWNVRRQGKYNAIADGEVTKHAKHGTTPATDWIVIENNHPAVIDHKTFDKVQASLSGRQRTTTPHKNGGSFLLTHICRCGKCGGAMVGNAAGGKPRYLCDRHQRGGECDRNAVEQSDLLDNIVAALQEKVLAPRNVERLRASLKKQSAAKVNEVDHAALERQLATVEAKLAKATRRLVEVDADLLDVVQGEVRRLRGEQEQLQATLKAARTPRQAIFTDMVQKLDAAIERLQRLRDAVQEGDPVKVREFLRQAIDHVEVHAVKVKRGKRDVYRLQRGSIFLKGDELSHLSGLSRPTCHSRIGRKC